MIFEGISTAIITPFDKDLKINYSKFKKLIDIQINNGIKCITICGTTGEASTLTLDEKKSIILFAVNHINKRAKIIIGTGSNDTRKVIELNKYVETLNVDGLLIVTPYYNKCTQKGLYLHYNKIANNTKLPIILYNVPSRTGVNLNKNTVIKLSKINNIVGLKQASNNLSETIQIINETDNDFSVYSGNDDLILPILSIGGKGAISVISNILPKEFNLLYNSFINNNIELSKEIQVKYIELIKILFIEVNPIPIKECMNMLGYNVGETRLPLCSMNKENKDKLLLCLENYKLL